MIKHRSSRYGWYIHNRCFHVECRKQGKFKQLDVVCFDNESCVLANKIHVFCLAPKVTGQPIQYFCFTLPKTNSDSIFRTISCSHSLVNLFVEIMFTACFC